MSKTQVGDARNADPIDLQQQRSGLDLGSLVTAEDRLEASILQLALPKGMSVSICKNNSAGSEEIDVLLTFKSGEIGTLVALEASIDIASSLIKRNHSEKVYVEIEGHALEIEPKETVASLSEKLVRAISGEARVRKLREQIYGDSTSEAAEFSAEQRVQELRRIIIGDELGLGGDASSETIDLSGSLSARGSNGAHAFPDLNQLAPGLLDPDEEID